MDLKNIKISADKILSISAIVIAVVSIIISVWEGMETRKHNRLSVLPKLEITFSRSNDKFGYIITNNGLGPAVIVKKKIFIDEEEINYTGFSDIDDFLEKLNLKNKLIKQGVVNPGYTIGAGDQVQIVYFTLSGSENPEELLMEVYNRVSFEIEYESMYGETYICRIN